MLKYRFSCLMLGSILGLTACGGQDDRSIDNPNTDESTRVVFIPALGQIPVPSDLQFASQIPADGTMNAGYDATNPVVTGIDALDGNSVLAPFDVKFNGPLDPDQTLDAASFVVVNGAILPNPSQNIFLLPLEYPAGDPLTAVKVQLDETTTLSEIPTFRDALSYVSNATAFQLDPMDTEALAALQQLAAPSVRASIISLDGGVDNVIRIEPLVPLQSKTRYLVVVTNIVDANGNDVLPSENYERLSDPTLEAPIDSLAGLASAILGWEQLAAGYFGFMDSIYAAQSLQDVFAAPETSDILLTMTFTTGGTTEVMQSLAAPEAYFSGARSTSYKQDAITKLLNGTISIQGTTTGDATDAAVAATLNGLLTSDTSPLYNTAIAGAIASSSSVEYATIAQQGSSAIFLMQKAAAEAAVLVQDPVAAGAQTVTQIMEGVSAANGSPVTLPKSVLFPVASPRSSVFYREDSLPSISVAIDAPAILSQGAITLPYYQQLPVETESGRDLSPVITGSWIADATIGGILDTSGNTPATDKTSYRFPFPTKTDDVTVPLIAVTPDTTTYGPLGLTKPAEGWPVIIYVHGITVDRSTALPMATALANACIATDNGTPTGLRPGVPCFATIAIDQPLHGVTGQSTVIPISDTESISIEGSIVPGLRSVNDDSVTITPNIGDNTVPAGLTERHFDITAAANGTTPIEIDYDSVPGSSGSLFINLTNFENARDNLRQMMLDLLNLNASIPTMDIDDDGTPDFDSSRVYLVGNSLGGIDGLSFVAINNSIATQAYSEVELPYINAAVGLNTGGGITRLLTNSQSFAPTVVGGLSLASSELAQGRSGLETYLNVFQGILDSADVTNYASMLSDANSDTGILLTEIVGNDTNPADATIPNAADEIWGTPPLYAVDPTTGFTVDQLPAPFAGTEPMIAQFGAVASADADATTDSDAEVIVTRFTEGSHGTPVSADNAAVFFEMVSQITTFFTLNGEVDGTIISNSTIIESTAE